MKKLLFTILVLYLSIDNAQPTQEIEKQDHNDWDVLIFTQQWPETVCKEWVHNNPSHSCNMPKKADSWAIHGIWPTKFGTRGPAFCNRTWHFDPEQVRPIETELIDSWTNIESGTEKYSFWAHEWSKHGTCAAVLEPLNSEFKYFSKGLNWGEKYDMGRILSDKGIVPDDKKLYSLTDIHMAVKTSLGVNPSIQCRKEDGKSYLVEIRICFDKNLGLHDCDGITWFNLFKYYTILTNCDHSEGILYPHNKWPINKFYVDMYKLVSWLQWFTL